MYRRVAALVAARPAVASTRGVLDLLANNDRTKTRHCVKFLRTLSTEGTHYVHRGAQLGGTHPFREAQLSVWAPEEDTSVKVSHHGSHNGTPTDGIFEAILPPAPPDGRPRHAVISAWDETYPGIPHSPTNIRLAERATLHTTLDRREDLYYDVVFPG